MYQRTFATLNISSTGVRLLSIKGRGVEKWGSAPLPPGLVRDGLILRPKVVGAVISALFKSTDIPRERVITSITGLSFIHRILSLPRMKRDSLREAIQRAARKEMPLPPEELYLCQQAISNGANEVDFFVLGVPGKAVDVLVQTLKEAGIKPYLADLNPLALARVANREEAIIVNLERDCFDTVLVADGRPAVMRTISPRGEGATLEDNIRRLADELLKTIEFYNNNHPEKPISNTAPLLVTGELSADAAAGELILAESGHPVEPLKLPLNLPHGFPGVLFAVNIGLALKKLPLKAAASGKATPFQDINLNILSGKFGTGSRRPSRQVILLSLAAVIGLQLLLPVNLMRSQADVETVRLQNELTGANQRVEQARLLADQAKQIEGTISRMAANTETAKREYQYILSKGGDFAGNLELVTDAQPGTAYFASVEMDNSQIIVKGEAESSFSVVHYVQALEALGKFPEVRIVSIDESKAAGVSFNIIISK